MYKKLNYTDFLKIEPTFLSLDISVNSTGWVRSIDGLVEWGTFSLMSEDELGRRMEFREFLERLIGDVMFPVVYVEDVIGGTNFKTTKGLIQLNTIVDDLKAYGIVKVGEIIREDNKRWKKYLKQAANYESQIKKENDKQLIRSSLNSIGFEVEGFKVSESQDIYDAMGLAIAMIFKHSVLKETRNTTEPLKMDLKRNYILKQVKSKEELVILGHQEAIKLCREVEEVSWVDKKRDILYLFKQKVKKEQRDDKIYLISINSNKLGVLALTKKLDTDADVAYLMVTRRK